MAVNKVKAGQSTKQPAEVSKDMKDHIFVTVQKKKVKISYDEILYIESQQEYIKMVTTKKVYFSKMTTNEMESLLPVHLFRRIHRSYIVSVNKIDSYNAEAVEVGGILIPVGRSYRNLLGSI